MGVSTTYLCSGSGQTIEYSIPRDDYLESAIVHLGLVQDMTQTRIQLTVDRVEIGILPSATVLVVLETVHFAPVVD